MPALTPEFMFDLESNMRLITSNEYQRLLSALWWQRIAKRMPSGAKRERIIWLLDTAKIEPVEGGQVSFEDIVSQTTEYENQNAAAGLKLLREQLEDLDGNGVQASAHWSRQMGAYAAYWPQKQLAKAIRDNPKTYDGKTFFATDHPVNPFKAGYGTYANDFTGAVSGSYPGAIVLDVSVALDVAINNLSKFIAYASTIKMPNGEDPRFLRVGSIFAPPAMMTRVTQLTSAKYIAQVAGAAGTAAGSGDVEAVIRRFGLGQPVETPELAAAFGGSDTTCYIGMEEITSNELGAFTYVDREPFAVIYHGPMTDAELARKREFEWTNAGRNTVGAGHPYLLHRLQGS